MQTKEVQGKLWGQSQLIQMLLMPLLVAVWLLSCKKETQTDTSSPAYHIAESEKLAIPAAIDLPAQTKGLTRIATFYAEGVQKYKSQLKAGSMPATYEWVFVAPQADLFDATNKKVGSHGAGPFWQLSAADSIFAQPFTPPKSAPSDAPINIDWLLLMPKQGKVPTGIFVDVSYIQRIATKGGKAPITLPVRADETAEIPYTAIYRFTKKNP